MDQEFLFLDKNNIDIFYNIFIEAKQDQDITYTITQERFSDYLLQLNVQEETSFLLKDNGNNIGIFISAIRGTTAYISTLAVINKHRGMGYGRILLQKGSSLLSENGCENVVLEVLKTNESAIKLYTSEGFKINNNILNFNNEDNSFFTTNNLNSYSIKKEEPLIFHILYKAFQHKRRPWQKHLTSILLKLRKGLSEIYLIKKKNMVTCGYFVITRVNNLILIEDFSLRESEYRLFNYFLSSLVINKGRIIIANSFYQDDPLCSLLENNGFYVYLKQYEMGKTLL